MITNFISDLLSDAAVPMLVIISIRIILDKKLLLRQYVILFIVTQLLVMAEHVLLRYTNDNSLKSFLIFYLGCVLETAQVLWAFCYTIKGESIARAYLIFGVYIQFVNGIVGYLCGLSDELAYALKAHIILRKPAPLGPVMIIALLHVVVGILLAIPVRKLTLHKQRFEAGMYRWIMVLFLSILVVLGTIRHGYYNVLSQKENVGDITQIVIITSITFVIIFILINALIYFINAYELKRMRQEQYETEKWIGSLQQQYLHINEENRKMKQILKSDSTNQNHIHIQQNSVSLTGNLLLDTLFTYYSHMAKEKNVVFEIQSELAGGEVKKYDQFYIDAGTKLVEEAIKDEGEKKEEAFVSQEDARLMNQVDLVTISDGVLSVYFEEAEEKEGYIFVNLKLGGGKLMLDYELNKDLDIHKLSFGTCKQYKKLKPVRRIVHLKNGVVSCVSKEGRQRISVMFVK